MILYRLMEDNRWLNLLEGSCISEEKYKEVYYISKPLFEIVEEIEIKDMVEYVNEGYCIDKGVEKILFYNERELQNFLNKL